MGNSGRHRRARTFGIAAVAVAAVGATAAVVSLDVGPARANVDQAQGQIRAANAAGSVPGSYIVVLKDAAVGKGVAAKNQVRANVGTMAQNMAGRYGAQVARTYGSALSGFAITASETDAKRLAGDPNVAYVQQNRRVRALDTQENPPSYGIDRVDQRDLPLDKSYTFETEAENVTAYVIDTGVRATHETFGGRVSGGRDFIDNDDDPDDENGHGTHVAGTIGGEEFGLAKGVQIVPVRVLDAEGSGSTDGVIAGIDFVAQDASGPSVANMSLGGGVDDALDAAVGGAIDAGVTFAVAAGNEAADASGSSPARVEAALTVAASDENDQQADFSNFGDVVDLYAPGVDITSSFNGSDDATETISGTSMSTPHVAGAVALFLADNPDATPAEVSEALTGAATEDKIENATPGTANRLLFTGSE